MRRCYLLLACVLILLSCVAASVSAAPFITAGVTPQNPPAANGAFSISASATDTNGGTITGLRYAVVSSGGSVDNEDFDATGHATYNLGPNGGSTARAYTVKIYATDQAGYTEKDFPVTQAAFKPIAITAGVMPQNPPAANGAFSISASATDTNGGTITGLRYAVVSSGGSVDNEDFDATGHATYNLGPNGGSTARAYTVKIYATDQAGYTEKDFPVTQAAFKPIAITAGVMPQNPPAANGAFSISASATDTNGGTITGLRYAVVSSGGSVDNEDFDATGHATYNLGPNGGSTARAYTVKIYATDQAGYTEKDFPVTQAAFKPIAITAGVMPQNPPAANGAFSISASATDTNGGTITGLRYAVVSSGGSVDNEDFDATGHATYNLGPNGGSTARAYTVKIYATDQAGYTEKDFPVTQAAFKPIAITAGVMPQNPPAANGAFSISASATDTNGGTITGLRYAVVSSGGSVDNEDFDATGHATYNLGPNGGSTARAYTVKIYATDQAGYTEKDFPVTQAAFKPIAITAGVTPQNPPAANGAFSISASAADTNGGTVTSLYYETINTSGSVAYAGNFDNNGTATYNFGVNNGINPLVYAIRIVAQDQAGYTFKDIPVIQAGLFNPTDKTLGQPSDGEPAVGEPINVATGDVYDQITDYETAGPNRLNLTRYYNSLSSPSPVPTLMGRNWRTNYDRSLWIISSTVVAAERADGQVLPFTFSGGAWVSDSDVGVRLTQSGAAWTLTDTDDTVETYSTSSPNEAILTSVKARGGYTQTLNYNAGSQLTSVTDSYNRTLNFTYQSGLVQTVTTPDGLILTYGYDSSGETPGVLDRLDSVAYSTTPQTGQTYSYGQSGLPFALTGIIDENGNRFTTWTYDQNGRGLSSQLGSGASLTTVAYNDSDGSRTVTNPLGGQEIYRFTTLQNIPKVTEIDRLATNTTSTAKETFAYDSNGYLASVTDWNGNLTTYSNDSLGRLTKTVEAVGTPLARSTAIIYYGGYHLPLQIVTPQLTSTFVYDANANLLTKTLTDTTTTTVPYSTNGQTRTWTYTWANALLTSVQNPRTDVMAITRFFYDGSGTLVKTTNALGQTVQVTQHTPGGLPLTVIDANGVMSQLTYDARLRLTSSSVNISTGVLTTHFVYDPAGNLLTVTLPDGSATANRYDSAHRLTGTMDLLGQTIAYTLDAAGDRIQADTANAAGIVQRQHADSFDALGRLIVDTGGAGQRTGYTYDANGNPLVVTDPLHHTRSQTFDALNRPATVTDPTNGITTTTYDNQDQLETVMPPNNSQTAYTYDGFGEVIEQSSPDTHNTVYVYDPDGNLTEKIDATRAVVNYTYDALDRVTTATYPGDATENVTYTYDQAGSGFGVGRLTSVKDAAGTLTRQYGARGFVTNEIRSIGTKTLTTAYAYDAAGRLASATYPSGFSVSYVRDVMGRATSVVLRNPGSPSVRTVVSNIRYEPLGPVNALLFGNGIAETHTFDNDYRTTGITDTGASVLQSLAYVYDPADNVQAINDGVTPSNSQTFLYDAQNRLTSAAGSDSTLTYTYGIMGNRLTQRAGSAVTAYTYTPGTNQLSAVTFGGVSQVVSYTLAGNISTISSSPISNLVYNQAGRLALVMSGSQPVAQYVYDAFGERLAKSTSSGGTFYQYDQQGRMLEETATGASALADYIYLDDGRLIATLTPATGSLNYIHADRLGTPRFTTNDSQAVTWSTTYQPFGQTNAVTGKITQNLRLPGQYADAETGWSQNGFRDYVPSLGRYLESDPIGLNGGINTYVYADSNPIANEDPSGRSWTQFLGAVGGYLFDKGYQSFSGSEGDSSDGSACGKETAEINKDLLTETALHGSASVGKLVGSDVFEDLEKGHDIYDKLNAGYDVVKSMVQYDRSDPSPYPIIAMMGKVNALLASDFGLSSALIEKGTGTTIEGYTSLISLGSKTDRQGFQYLFDNGFLGPDVVQRPK